MKPNLGNLDRIIWAILGLAIIVLGIVFRSWWGVVGVIIAATSAFSFCPVYYLLGIRTNEKK